MQVGELRVLRETDHAASHRLRELLFVCAFADFHGSKLAFMEDFRGSRSVVETARRAVSTILKLE